MTRKLKYLLLLMFTITLIINAQTIENQYLYFFGGAPESEIKMNGIGSLGFDEFGNSYNPKYLNLRKHITLNGGILYNTVGNIYEGVTNVGEEKGFKSNQRILPSFGLLVKEGKWLFQLDYFYSTYSDITRLVGTGGFNFLTQSGIRYFTSSSNTNFKLINERFQIALTRNISNDLSLGIGLIFNGTSTITDFNNEIGEMEFFVSLLDYPQVLASINYSLNPINLYLIYKSQRKELNTESSFRIYGEILSRYMYPIISFPGLLGYGLQYKITKDLSISLEISHNFLVEDVTRPVNNYDKVHVHHDIWNNELAIGAKYKLLNSFSIGVLYDFYLKYDIIGLPKEYAHSCLNQLLPEVKSLKYLIFSGLYENELFSFIIQYQHTILNETFTIDSNNIYRNKYKNAIKCLISFPINF